METAVADRGTWRYIDACEQLAFPVLQFGKDIFRHTNRTKLLKVEKTSTSGHPTGLLRILTF